MHLDTGASEASVCASLTFGADKRIIRLWTVFAQRVLKLLGSRLRVAVEPQHGKLACQVSILNANGGFSQTELKQFREISVGYSEIKRRALIHGCLNPDASAMALNNPLHQR